MLNLSEVCTQDGLFSATLSQHSEYSMLYASGVPETRVLDYHLVYKLKCHYNSGVYYMAFFHQRFPIRPLQS